VETDSSLKTLLIFAGFGAVVAMLIALVLGSLVWVVVFAVPAVICLSLIKLVEYSATSKWPPELRRALDRAKRPAGILHLGYEVQITFMNLAFASEFRRRNGTEVAEGDNPT